MESMIRLEHVTKTFPGARGPAVGDLSFEVPEGEVACLVGPSGCGKTTTLRMINRLIEPSGGTITVAGRDIRTLPAYELRRGIGYVIQQVGLFAHRTVAENVATVPKLLGWDKTRIETRVLELLDLIGLDRGLGDRYPSELSGGQQQRVGVARALAADPPVLLMDEPFGAVDPIVRLRLQDELRGLQERLRKTIVFVTHDIDEAIRLGDRVVVLNVGAVVEQIASPTELLGGPSSAFVAEFIGADRGIRRLSLIAVRDIELDGGSRDSRPEVGPDATLLDALQTILQARAEAADVLDGDDYLGSLTLERISREVK